jgi:acid phosphatase family membrane protein YuiD
MYSDKYVLKLFLGLIFLQIFVKFLKKLFKESRPIKSNTYGLPSTKAATLVFIATYLILTNKLNSSTVLILLVALILPLFMKYYSREHSMKQIVVGSIIGLSVAYIIVKLI